MSDIHGLIEEGRRPRPFAHLMMGKKRVDNIHDCMNVIIRDGIQGDFVETGVWKGGGTVFMRAFLKAHGIEDRLVWIADSFEGVPKATLEQDAGINLSADAIPWIAVSQERVQNLFRKYGLLDDQVRFLK